VHMVKKIVKEEVVSVRRILIVFAKEPQKGKVKTRLSRHLSQEGCLKLYKELLADTLGRARKIKCSHKVLAYDSASKKPVYLKKIAADFQFYKQEGGDLGERMFNAFKAYAAPGACVVIIGSDSPNLPLTYINRAFLELSKRDLVLGPAYDGGYYLIGLKEPCRKIFKGVKWSCCSVFKETLKRIRELKKTTAILPPWYDIDTPQDLKYFKPGICISSRRI